MYMWYFLIPIEMYLKINPVITKNNLFRETAFNVCLVRCYHEADGLR